MLLIHIYDKINGVIKARLELPIVPQIGSTFECENPSYMGRIIAIDYKLTANDTKLIALVVCEAI